MNNYRDILVNVLLRALCALPFLAFGWFLLAKASGGFESMGRLMFGMAFIIVAAVIVAPGMARLIVEPLGSIYMPGDYLDKAPPLYSIPEAKRKKGLPREAMEGFRAIAQAYPNEVKPWIAMVDIALMDLKDRELAERTYVEGLRALRKIADQTTLTVMYNAIRTRLEPPPERPPLTMKPGG